MIFWPQFAAFLQILVIDLSLAGDNAIAVGMAAGGLAPDRRRHAVLAGIAAATVLRILFAVFAVKLLHFTGLLLAGGFLLLWVAWKMFREIHALNSAKAPAKVSGHKSKQPRKSLAAAITQIVIADVSMSLDNVLAVAGVARDQIWILIAGLALSVILMGAAASLVARLTSRYSWIAYVGLAVVFYTAVKMMVDGGLAVLLRHAT